MPIAAKRPCKKPGCHKLVTSGYCDDHQGETRQYDKGRGTASQRGYTSAWARYSRAYRRKNPLCVMCQAEGRLRVADHVDHIKAVSGPDDPLFWEPSNHQSICISHHSQKTAKEDCGFGNKGRGGNER